MSDARAILACLANEEVARVLAHIVLRGVAGDELPISRRRKAIASLVHSGLVVETGEHLELHRAGINTALRGLVRSRADRTANPTSRWLDDEGRIAQYPRRPGDRSELLQQLGTRVIDAGERLTEHEMNARLEPYTADVPTLRRYLIVHGVVAREPDGSAYWRASP